MRHSWPAMPARAVSAGLAVALLLIFSLSACGGGGDGATLGPGPSTYNIAAGVSGLATHGMKANLIVSGSVTVGAVAVPLSGTGTYSLAAAVTGTFNGAAARAQVGSIYATVIAGGASSSYLRSVTDYYDPGIYALLGEASTGEYDVAQAPITFPTMVAPGSSGTLGTLSRYTDETLGVVLGTAQLSYVLTVPATAGAPATVEFTQKFYDTHQAVTATEVRDYSLTATNTMLLVSLTILKAPDTLTVTVK